MDPDVLFFAGALAVAVSMALPVMLVVARVIHRREVPDDGLAVVDEAMEPEERPRPRRYRGSRRAGVRPPIQPPCARGSVRVPRWEDPTRTTVIVQTFPPPGARGVARVGGGRRG